MRLTYTDLQYRKPVKGYATGSPPREECNRNWEVAGTSPVLANLLSLRFIVLAVTVTRVMHQKCTGCAISLRNNSGTFFAERA